MAHIQKRTLPSGRTSYRVRYVDDCGDERSRSFPTKNAAQAFADTTAGDLVRGTYIDPDAGRQTLGDFIDDEWLPAQDGWKETTADKWPTHRQRIERCGLARMPLGNIDELALRAARARLRESLAVTTTNLTMVMVGAVLRSAHENRRIARNPASTLEPLKPRAGEPDGKVRPQDVPTTAEAISILAAAAPAHRAAVALGLAGLRRGEVLGLSVDRIDVDRRLVTVDRQLQIVGGRLVLTTPKAEKVRTIEVPPQIAWELRRHLRDHHDPSRLHEGAALLVQGPRANFIRPTEFYRQVWQPTLTAAGLDVDRFKFHALRHFCASSLLQNGADVAMVAGHIGDSVGVVQRVYVHWLRDARHVPAEILDRVLAPAAGAASTG